MRRPPGSPNVLGPCSTPGTLWASIVAVCLIFFLFSWPSNPDVAVVNGHGARKVGPKDIDLDAGAGAGLSSSGAGVGVGVGAAASAPAAGAASVQRHHQLSAAVPTPGDPSAAPADKVLLELFVMSLCPDARFCETHFNKLLGESKALRSLVHVAPHWIQFDNPGSAESGGVACPHGPEECAGNLLQACVAAHTPPAKNFDWVVGYLMCSWEGDGPMDSKSAFKACLDKIGVTQAARDAITKCVDGPEGAALMKASAAIVKARGVKRSCTVAIEGKKRCIRDGGQWYDCEGGSSPEEFTASLCAAYRSKTGREPPAAACPAAAAAAAAAKPAASG